MAASLVGGIALLAVGAGLQAERPASGRHAMIVTGAMTATYLCIAGVLLFKSGAPIAAATAGILGVLSLLLFMLAGHSAAVLRAHPPRDNGTLARDLDRELTDRRTRVLDDPDA